MTKIQIAILVGFCALVVTIWWPEDAAHRALHHLANAESLTKQADAEVAAAKKDLQIAEGNK